MTCCGGNIAAQEAVNGTGPAADTIAESELRHSATELPSGETQYVFSSPAIHCGSCIRIIESELSEMPGVAGVRVNLTLKRIVLTLENDKVSPLAHFRKLEKLGFPVQTVDLGDQAVHLQKQQSARLLRAMAVAGFSAMNIMLLSVSTWSGAEGTTRDLFHLISALIAIPTVFYSGRVFFVSALKALSNRHLNMDVPISLAVLLALGMSVFETLNHGEVAYFDAAVSLLFFLLIGRYLDQLMRERARNAVSTLSRLAAKGATVIHANGKLAYLPIDEIEAGQILRLLPGDKIPVDGELVSGVSDFDLSLVTGESVPVTKTNGDEVQAGTHNLTGVVTMRVIRPAASSFLAEVTQMLSAAENGRGAYVRVADRMARLYAPAVHLLALMAFVTWMVSTGGDWQHSLYVAIAVLIITCPCALGLAVPVVHVIGAGTLFEKGILMKDGSALERLAEVDHVVFDKTGTLTMPRPDVVDDHIVSAEHRKLAAILAAHSSHPSSRAVVAHLRDFSDDSVDDIREVAGSGVQAIYKNRRIRLGKRSWVMEIAGQNDWQPPLDWSLIFAIEGAPPSGFRLHEKLRVGAARTVKELAIQGYPSEILSGDLPDHVQKIAEETGIGEYRGNCSPSDKISRIYALRDDGRHVLMVGDGLNDAPSLAAGHASMAPASASDIGRQAADFVFTRENLDAVLTAMRIARKSRTLIRQNFGLAIAYNCIAVPLAFVGYVTPLFAAIAMSASSIVVVLNSLRLSYDGTEAGEPGQAVVSKMLGEAA